MQKYFLVLALLSATCQASTIKISPASIAQYKETIDPFLVQKKQELKNLNKLPNGNSFLGMVTNFVIESVVSPLMGYGNIDIERAKVFLGRSFAHENQLKAALTNLESSQDNIQFIASIFKELPQQVIEKKNKAAFYEVVRQIKHPNVPNPKQMGDKNSQGHYIIADNNFYQLAACTFMTFHIFETNLKTTSKKRIV